MRGKSEVLGRGRGGGSPSAPEITQIIQAYNSRQEQQANVRGLLEKYPTVFFYANT